MNEIERRYFTGDLQIAEQEAGPPKIIGYAAKFNVLSEELPGPNGKRFRERLVPGAFSRTLAANDDVFALVEHSPNHKLGRRSNGTLKLTQDEVGLRVEVTPPDTTIGRDTIAEIRQGLLSGWSFAFRASYADQEWSRTENDGTIRSLKSLDLGEVTITGSPAYPDTELALRSLNEWIQEQQSASQAQLTAEHQLRANKLRLLEQS